MDLSYGPEYETYREEVRAFLEANWPLEGDDANLPPEEQAVVFRKRAIAAGYLGRNIPKQFGGSEQEPDALKGQVIREEFGRKWAPMDAPGIGTMMLVPTLLERGEAVAEGEVGRGHHPRPHPVVSGIQRARLGFGPGLAQDQGRTRR